MVEKFSPDQKFSASLISVIIPVYNLAPYIRDCIESIRNQTYAQWEMILVDDGSTDDSGIICDEAASWDSRIQVIHQKNGGVVAARGRGLQAASGKYISFVDGDDRIEPNMIEMMAAHIGGVDLVTVGVFEQLSPDQTVERYDEFPEGRYSGNEQLGELLKKMLYDSDKERLQRFTPWCHNKLWRRELLRNVYKEIDPQITFAEDAVLVYKYLLKCRSVVILHQCFYHYRYRKESALHRMNNRMLMNINRVYLALEADFRAHSLADSLLLQLQKWILIMDIWAINGYMGFDERIGIPEFVIDTSGLENKRLILYGAGRVGRMACGQFKKFGFSVVLWVDQNYRHYQRMDMQVAAPEDILDREYDVLYIAVSERTVAEKIKADLQQMGISPGKIIWKEPMRIF